MEQQLDIKPKVQAEQKAEDQQEYKLVGRILMKKGLKLYSFNIDTKMIEEVEIDRQVAIGMNGKEKKDSRVNRDPKAIYLQALNMRNAKRKVLKLIEEYR